MFTLVFMWSGKLASTGKNTPVYLSHIRCSIRKTSRWPVWWYYWFTKDCFSLRTVMIKLQYQNQTVYLVFMKTVKSRKIFNISSFHIKTSSMPRTSHSAITVSTYIYIYSYQWRLSKYSKWKLFLFSVFHLKFTVFFFRIIQYS